MTALSPELRQKVFCVGMPKTGTSTLADALTLLGFRHQTGPVEQLLRSYRRGHIGELLQRLDELDSVDDLPWCFMYRELDEAFPDARFILTRRRDVDVWFRSLCDHHDRTGKRAARKLAYGYRSPRDNPEHHKQLYESHNVAVREYFRGRKNFIELCWEDGDGWAELCNFVSMEIPDGMDFPHSRRDRRPKQIKALGRFVGTNLPCLIPVYRRMTLLLSSFMRAVRRRAAWLRAWRHEDDR